LPADDSVMLGTVADLARSYMISGRRPEAGKLLADGIAVLRKSPERSSLGAGWLLILQGEFLKRDGRPAEALPVLPEGYTICEPHWSPNDPSPQVLLGNIAGAMHGVGQRAEAEAQTAKAIEQCERAHGAENPGVGWLLLQQGSFLLQREAWQEALPLLER